jgi:excisionase family DNA binding protein
MNGLMVKAQVGRWLSLGEAASLLGVDEATLRHWADTGRIRTFRTPGGHRRFQEDDLLALIQQEVPRVEDLSGLVERRSAKLLAGSPGKALHGLPWFSSLDDRLRTRARDHGRRVFAAVVAYIARPAERRTIRERLLDQAQAYGAELRRAGMDPADAAEAFSFFRHMVLKMITEPRGRGGMLDETQVKALIDTSGLLDAVFLVMLKAWSVTQAPGPRSRVSGHARAETPP